MQRFNFNRCQVSKLFMKYISSTQKILFKIAVTLTLIAFACRKETSSLNNQNLETNKLAFLFLNENRIRINQAITIYDSTFTLINDSMDFALVAFDRYYDWEVIPNNGCDSIWNNKGRGTTNFTFNCAGTYLLTAKIYDSARQSLIGTTDTLKINVTSDTLLPTQQIKEDDILNIQTGITKSNSDIADEVWIYLNLLSTKSYNNYSPYIQFDYTSSIDANNYNYTFSDIELNSYPFAFGSYTTTGKVYGWINLKELSYGVPANLSITWLNTTYTGTVTLLNENQYTFTWNNSGAVKMY